MKCVLNGKKVELQGKKTILEAAREHGISIPSLCDHHRLSPFSGCRLCLVEVEGRRGFVPSCSTFVEEEMVVSTDSPQLKKLRRQILELILSEHPSACLICSEKQECDDKKATIRKVGETTGCVLCPNNGRCELQEVTEALGLDKIEFPALYRDLEIRKDDPFFDRNYNLCILCGRCARMCHEVRGASAVSFVHRGSEEIIGTVFDRSLLESGCQFCGACVDVCPTGALSERTLKYESLPQQIKRTICPLCGAGCTLDVEVRQDRIISSRPSEDSTVNRGQGCVKGRFVLRDVVHSSERIAKPMVRKGNELEEVGWDEAFDFVAHRLRSFKARETALVDSPNLSCEDLYIARKFAREVLKTKNVTSFPDSILFSRPSSQEDKAAYTGPLNFKMGEIAQAATVVLLGSDLTVTHPMIWLETLQAVRNGGQLIVIGPVEFPLIRHAAHWLRCKPGIEKFIIGYLTKLIAEDFECFDPVEMEGGDVFMNSLGGLSLEDAELITGIKESELRKVSHFFTNGGPVVFLFGSELIRSRRGKEELLSLQNLAIMTSGQMVPLGMENNQRGLLELAGMNRYANKNFDTVFQSISSGRIKALYLTGAFPWPEKMNIDFIIFQGNYACKEARMADAVLPAATFAETQGTYVNNEGRVQYFDSLIEPLGEARPDWWIFSQIARRMKAEGFAFRKITDIDNEIKKNIPGFKGISWKDINAGKEVFMKEASTGPAKLVPVKLVPSPLQSSKKYPFQMLKADSPDVYRNLALGDEVKGLRTIRESGCLQVCPEDADRSGLENGETVEVISEWGKFTARAKVTSAVRPGFVRVSFSWPEHPDFYAAFLASGGKEGAESHRVFPVKLKRGK